MELFYISLILVFLYAYIFLNSKCGVIVYFSFITFHLAIYCDNPFLIIKLICVSKCITIKITNNTLPKDNHC